MTDMSKCSGEGCPLKDNCLRYTLPTNDLWQSFLAPAYDGHRMTCWNRLQDTKSVNKRIEVQRGKE